MSESILKQVPAFKNNNTLLSLCSYFKFVHVFLYSICKILVYIKYQKFICTQFYNIYNFFLLVLDIKIYIIFYNKKSNNVFIICKSSYNCILSKTATSKMFLETDLNFDYKVYFYFLFKTYVFKLFFLISQNYNLFLNTLKNS